MSLLFCDSFRHYGVGTASVPYIYKKWTGASGTQVTTDGPNSGYACSLGQLNKTIVNTSGSGNSFANMWKFRITDLSGGGNPGGLAFGMGYSINCLTKGHNLAPVFNIVLEPDGIFSIYGNNVLNNRITSLPMHMGVWYTVETNVFVSGLMSGLMGGTYFVRINTLQVASGILNTDVAVAGLLGTVPTSFQWAGGGLGALAEIAYPFIYDDSGDPGASYNMTSAISGSGAPIFWAGDAYILRVRPNGDVQKQWDSTGSNNWDQINDDGPPDITTYVSSATPGQIDTYDWEDVPSNVNILSVQKSMYSRKSDAGTRMVSQRADDTGTELIGGIHPLADDYYYEHAARDNNPTDGTQWTPSSFNPKRFGQCLES